MQGLVPGHHVSTVFGVVVGVDDYEEGVVHVSLLRATGDVDKIEFHGLSVWRDPCRHARPIAGVTIMGQEQAVPVQIKHGYGMVVWSGIIRRSRLLHLM